MNNIHEAFILEQKFYPWGKTQSYANLMKHFNKMQFGGSVVYRPKAKLDGTNGAVQVHPDGSLVVQSRKRIITIKDDNYGFANWVNSKRSVWSGMAKDHLLVFYGEWCGTGIQDRTAVSQIGKKVFAIFGVTEVTADGHEMYHYDPNIITAALHGPEYPPDHDIYVIPYMSEHYTVHPQDRHSVNAVADSINALVDRVEAVDPWVNNVFGVEGLGEGVVLFPTHCSGSSDTDEVYFPTNGPTQYLIKAKGEKHRVNKTGKAAQPMAVIPESAYAFVDMFGTPQRYEQGLTEACEGIADKKLTGKFMSWVMQDIMAESKDELDGADFTWKQVQGLIANSARAWFFDKCESLG